MINIDAATITDAVIAANAGCRSPRLREVMKSLCRHLHDFAREVHLSEDEWTEAIRFLARAGHITDAKRQEFILLSDVLGLSSLVIAQNNAKPKGCTEATVLGPFFVAGAPRVPNGSDIANGAKGTPCVVTGSTFFGAAFRTSNRTRCSACVRRWSPIGFGTSRPTASRITRWSTTSCSRGRKLDAPHRAH